MSDEIMYIFAGGDTTGSYLVIIQANDCIDARTNVLLNELLSDRLNFE